MENQVKTHIEIQGVILTPEAIEEIKFLQENNNHGIVSDNEYIADAISFLVIGMSTYGMDGDRDRIMRTITELSYIRETFKRIAKP